MEATTVERERIIGYKIAGNTKERLYTSATLLKQKIQPLIDKFESLGFSRSEFNLGLINEISNHEDDYKQKKANCRNCSNDEVPASPNWVVEKLVDDVINDGKMSFGGLKIDKKAIAKMIEVPENSEDFINSVKEVHNSMSTTTDEVYDALNIENGEVIISEEYIEEIAEKNTIRIKGLELDSFEELEVLKNFVNTLNKFLNSNQKIVLPPDYFYHSGSPGTPSTTNSLKEVNCYQLAKRMSKK
jgi:hypothetical protein